MRQAIHPDFFNNFPFLKKSEEAKEKGATEEERALYVMSLSSGWKILSDYINEWLEGLDRLNETAIASGASFEEIGKNTLVSNLAKGIIKRIKDKVEDSVGACERPTGGK